MARHTPPRVAIYRRHATKDTEPRSLAAQEAALRSYIAAHLDWEGITAVDVVDSDGSQPFDRARAARRPLLTSPPNEGPATDPPAPALRRR
ncbi:MAG: hypothetical protein QOH97_4707 [Actinoplanes sp.]|jgi:hypothetical protein|nr:hypothetical protein [Actinoplanes sp.]